MRGFTYEQVRAGWSEQSGDLLRMMRSQGRSCLDLGQINIVGQSVRRRFIGKPFRLFEGSNFFTAQSEGKRSIGNAGHGMVERHASVRGIASRGTVGNQRVVH